MESMAAMTRDEWLKLGYNLGYCGNTHCYTHYGAPMSKSEQQDFEDGSDWCITMLRIYDGPEQRDQVENIGHLQ